MKSLFEQSGGTYREENGYLIPSIEVPNDTVEIGKYGRLHRDYLKKNHRSIYGIILCNGSLLKRIESVDIQANELHNTLIPKYKKLYGVTEQLKYGA